MRVCEPWNDGAVFQIDQPCAPVLESQDSLGGSEFCYSAFRDGDSLDRRSAGRINVDSAIVEYGIRTFQV